MNGAQVDRVSGAFQLKGNMVVLRRRTVDNGLQQTAAEGLSPEVKDQRRLRGELDEMMAMTVVRQVPMIARTAGEADAVPVTTAIE